MDSEQAQDNGQKEQDHAKLRSERRTRGDTRDAHFEAGREQAQRDNALARERHAAEPAVVPALVDDKSDTDQQVEGDS